ncbi:hypothetical protein WEI85_00455 [Actinomycetes bacterium KLBMP 9797]
MTTRLWWRIEDVQHLAEHGAAAPQHRFTAAQAAAYGSDGPALIWTSTPEGDYLTSNGLPAWFDEFGHQYRVAADTWRHRATGRADTTRRHRDVVGWLPLSARSRRRGRTLIDCLRHGASRRAHWFVLDTAPGTGVRVRLLGHRGDIVPPHARWVPATVTADAVAGVEYAGLVADAYTALGGAIVRFTRDTVEQIADDLANLQAGAMPGEHPIVRMRGDVAVIFEHDDSNQTRLVEIDRAYPDHSGRLAVGAYLWPWRIVDETVP